MTSPLDNLTEEEQEKINQLRNITKEWNLEPEEEQFCTSVCLYRFLLGLSWDIEKASEQLKRTVEWRKEAKPQNIKLEDLRDVAEVGWLFDYGFDNIGRPVVYLLMAKDTIENTEEVKKKKFLVMAYLLEKCYAKCQGSAYNVTWVVDFKNASLSIELINKMRSVFSGIGDYYPENLAKCIVINAGWVVNILWGFARTFMAQRTLEKYVIPSEQELVNHIPKDQLISELGGDAEYTFKIE
jgi:hypothetical protein